MSTSFTHILLGDGRLKSPISEARLTHLRRVIRHVDFREDRTARGPCLFATRKLRRR